VRLSFLNVQRFDNADIGVALLFINFCCVLTKTTSKQAEKNAADNFLAWRVKMCSVYAWVDFQRALMCSFLQTFKIQIQDFMEISIFYVF
jgi:hypothetical protein